MIYQTFNEYGARFGRDTQNLKTAIKRVQACKGEVRPLGSLTAVYICRTMLSGEILVADRAWWHATRAAKPEAPKPQQFRPVYRTAQPCYARSTIRVWK